MASQPQPANSDNPNSPETKEVVEPFGSELSPMTRSVRKGQWIVTQIYTFLVQFTANLGQFFNQSQRTITIVLLLLVAIVALRLALAAMAALNDIPLLAPTLELVGIGYSVWFISRYLLTKSNRQELAQKVQQFLDEQT